MSEFEFSSPPRVNAFVRKECTTCHGDRMVVVATRPVQQTPWMKAHGITPPADASIEEVAPCPDCNSSTDTSFRRYDGSLVRPLDPGKVRELMNG